MSFHRDNDRATRGAGAIAAIDRFKSPARRARELAARRRTIALDLLRTRHRQLAMGRIKEESEQGGGGSGGAPATKHPLRTVPQVGQILSPAAKHPGVRATTTTISSLPVKVNVLPVTTTSPLRPTIGVAPIRDGLTAGVAISPNLPPKILTYPAPSPISPARLVGTSVTGGPWAVPVVQVAPTPLRPIGPPRDSGGAGTWGAPLAPPAPLEPFDEPIDDELEAPTVTPRLSKGVVLGGLALLALLLLSDRD